MFTSVATSGSKRRWGSFCVQVLMAATSLVCVPGCRVGPDYTRPTVATPAGWRWKNAEHAGDPAAFQHTWQVYNDPKLDELEAQALEANQEIKLALARVDESRALARLNKADFYPQVSAEPAYSRREQSGNVFIPGISSFAGSGGPGSIPGFRSPFNDFLLPLQTSYEADVWGRVRRTVAAGRNRAEASVADYEAVRLTVAADVAANYFLLRSLDSQIGVLQQSLELRKQSLDLVDKRVKSGVADELDLNRARTEVATSTASLADARGQRELRVNMIAVLCGKAASDFVVEAHALVGEPPGIPAGLPSLLLERRPDVVAAERRLAASCEEIGVAKAAYFPRFALTGSGGFESAELNQLFKGTSTVWNVAANIVQPVFTGGKNKAQLDAAKARFEEALAQYRQQTLVAFKDVEDALVEIRYLAEQAAALADAIESTRKVTALAAARYEGGRVSYLEVVDAQRQQLAVEQQAAQILGRRMAATARLIKALGGGWTGIDVVDAPKEK
jgi:outer membrane protein, multidrug efflux system